MGKSSNPGGAAGSGSSRRLGRGLSSLIDMPTVPVEVPTVEVATQGSVPEQAAATTGGIQMIEVGAISKSPFQPRREFSDRGIEELASSIRRSGMMQPVIVRPRAVGEFELVAGERRWRAAARAGLERVPALIRELSDEEAAEWAIVENVQREDLNAMEKAWAFRSLGERFGLSHGEIATRVGLDRSSVANLVRLTELEPEIAGLITAGRLSGGHGKALLQAPAGPGRIVLAKRAAEEQWSVRRLESECVGSSAPASPGGAVGGESAEGRVRAAMIEDLERQLGEHLGSKVTITTRADGKKGKIEVTFYDLDHFDDVMSRIGFRMR